MNDTLKIYGIYIEYNMLIQTILIILFISILFLILLHIETLKKEKLISKYSINRINNNNTLFDKCNSIYIKIINIISTVLAKSTLIKKYSLRYEKYRKSINYISFKILLFVFLMILVLIFNVINNYNINIVEVLLILIFSYLCPNIVSEIKYKINKNKLEDELFQAIVIMNTAFKSGKSIDQAIYSVVTDLDSDISEEFKRMHLELSFGLSIEQVFKNFSERTNLVEINYLTACLSVLNKTGGNIVKVFSLIEKNFYNKKQLRLELKSLTTSSKVVMYSLIIIPIIFIIIISLLNPDYFTPFYTTNLGYILLSIIILIYIIYIIVVSKIMKVRM